MSDPGNGLSPFERSARERVDEEVRLAKLRRIPLCCVFLRLGEAVEEGADAPSPALAEHCLRCVRRWVRQVDLVVPWGEAGIVVVSRNLTARGALSQARRLENRLAAGQPGMAAMPDVQVGVAFFHPRMRGALDLVGEAQRVLEPRPVGLPTSAADFLGVA